MRLLLGFFCVFLFVVFPSFVQPKKSVAIIGGGISGSSATYYLQKLLPDADVTLFEKFSDVGGRIKHVLIKGIPVELGADVFYRDNLRIQELIKEFGLKNVSGPLPIIGVWDGNQFFYKDSPYQILNAIYGVWRYGISSLYLQGTLDKITQRFLSQYSDTFEPWGSIEEWSSRLEFDDTLRLSTEQYLAKQGFSQTFIDEIASGITKVIYQQEVDNIHALAGLVSIVGSGENVASTNGGNKLIIDGLLQKTKPKILTSTRVNKIEKTSKGYRLTFTTNEQTQDKLFDAVILSTPFKNIDLIGVTPPPSYSYVRVYVTVLCGEPNPSYFGLDKEPPNFIMVSRGAQVPWTVSALMHEHNGKKIYKLFSPQSLADLLPQMFSQIEEKVEAKIEGYPYMPPNVTFAPIKLGPNFYYPSAFDAVVSCMETSLLSTHNAIRLLARDWVEFDKQQEQEQEQEQEQQEQRKQDL